MANLRVRPVVAFVAAASMVFSSTGAMAAGSSAPAPQQISPWAALSVLSAGAPAAALCGTAAATAAAAQPAAGCVLPAVDAPAPVAEPGPPAPVPVPPINAPSAGLGLGVSPLLLALGAIAAGAALYFLVIKKHHHHTTSPA